MSFGVLIWSEEIVVGIVALVALGIVLLRVRASKRTSAGQGLAGRVASMIAVCGVIAFWWPRWFGPWDQDPEWRYAIPITLASLAVCVFALSDVRLGRAGTLEQVDLAPRSMWSFGARSWFTGWWAAALLMATTTLLAGSASSTAGDGRYTVLTIRIGNGSMETEFFGWTYGIPVLIALGVLFAVTVGALWWIARPAVPSDLVLRELERAARRNRTRTVLALAVGATSFTLGQSWLIIGRSAALSAGVSISESTQIDVVTPFAVLSIPFMLLGFLLEGIGLALLLLPLFQPGHRPVSTGASRRGAQAPTERVP